MATDIRQEDGSRTWESDPDHHLWRNGRLWWVAFTVHQPGWRKDRVRASLGTADLGEARRRRDALLRHYAEAEGWQVSLRGAVRPRAAARHVSVDVTLRGPMTRARASTRTSAPSAAA